MSVRIYGYSCGAGRIDTSAEVPNCATGFVGRAGFVRRELRDVRRELRAAARARRDRPAGTGSQTEDEQ